MSDDFLTNVETAFLSLLQTNDYIAQYNWQRWDADQQVELPRGIIKIEGRRDPEGSAIYRLAIEVRFEGRPQKAKMSVVMNEVNALFKATAVDSLSNSDVKFFGRYAEEVAIRRANIGGLRVWYLAFVLFACPMT